MLRGSSAIRAGLLQTKLDMEIALKHAEEPGVQQRGQPCVRSLGIGRVAIIAICYIVKCVIDVFCRSGSARYTTEFLATGSSTWVQGAQVASTACLIRDSRQVPGAGMEDSCSVGISDDKLLAIGGYWETKQVIKYPCCSVSFE